MSVMIEYENTILEKTSNGVFDDELLRALYWFIFDCLWFNKKVNSYQQAYETAWIGAEDMFLMFYNGFRIKTSLKGYIFKRLQRYINEWVDTYKTEVIDTKGEREYVKAIFEMGCSTNYIEDLAEIECIDYIENLPRVIEKIANLSKYNKNTSQNKNIRLTLIFSLLRGKFTPYCIAEVDKAYVKILYNILIEKLTVETQSGRLNKEDVLEAYFKEFHLDFLESAYGETR